MQSIQSRSLARTLMKRFARDVGRGLLLFSILVAAFFATMLITAIVVGAILVPGGPAPAILSTGGEALAAALESFTHREFSIFIYSVIGALFTGMAAHWLYRQSLRRLARIRRQIQATQFD